MKRILDLFVKIEDDNVSSKQEKPSATSSSLQTNVTNGQALISEGQVDNEIKNQLAQALEKANMEGYDYFEFARSVDAQMNLIPAESLRFQSTFAVATSMGLSADKLISSAEYYLTILKKKEDEFNKALELHNCSAVIAKEDLIKKIDQDIQLKAEEIKRITVEINGMQQKKTALQSEISSAKTEINRIRENFVVTLKTFTCRISSDIEKMKSYLTGGK